MNTGIDYEADSESLFGKNVGRPGALPNGNQVFIRYSKTKIERSSILDEARKEKFPLQLSSASDGSSTKFLRSSMAKE
jgi:hypothetical protein